MPTEITLVEGETVTVSDDYRHVYEKLLSTNWQAPCEFLQAGAEAQQITINPAYIVFFRRA